jgi:hypothetical protein
MTTDIRQSLTWAGGIITLALVANFARAQGYIDGDSSTRLILGVNGILIAWYGNRLPKAFVPRAWTRRANRVAGWSMVISGLAYGALWAFAPTSIAFVGGCAAIITGVAVTYGYCLSLRRKANAG